MLSGNGFPSLNVEKDKTVLPFHGKAVSIIFSMKILRISPFFLLYCALLTGILSYTE